jgi:hypothetical protein
VALLGGVALKLGVGIDGSPNWLAVAAVIDDLLVVFKATLGILILFPAEAIELTALCNAAAADGGNFAVTAEANPLPDFTLVNNDDAASDTVLLILFIVPTLVPVIALFKSLVPGNGGTLPVNRLVTELTALAPPGNADKPLAVLVIIDFAVLTILEVAKSETVVGILLIAATVELLFLTALIKLLAIVPALGNNPDETVVAPVGIFEIVDVAGLVIFPTMLLVVSPATVVCTAF